jgi:hypothetical protein
MMAVIGEEPTAGWAAIKGRALATIRTFSGGFGAVVLAALRYSNAPASEPAPLELRVALCRGSTYCCDGVSGCPRLLFKTSPASAPPIPIALDPATRWTSSTVTNPGQLLPGDTRFEVPVTVPDVPLSQPGETQFDPNARLVVSQYANLIDGIDDPAVRGTTANMLLRMSITPGIVDAGGQSYPPYVVLNM